MRKRIGIKTCLALCLLLTVFSAASLVACNSIYTSTPNSTDTQKATSYVCIDVNPSVELVLDQNNVVMSASGANKDGKALLFEENGIVGAELDVAVSNVAALAVKYDYVKDGANVSVEVASANKNNDIFKRISDKFSSALKKSDASINVAFSESCDFVLENELETLKAQYPDNQKIQNLDVATFRLAKKAQQNGLSFDEVLNLSVESMIDAVNDLQSDLTQKFDESYQEAVNRAQYVFDSAKQVVENGVYAQYYAQKLFSLVNVNPLAALGVAKQTLNAARYAVASASKLALEFVYQSEFFGDNPTYKLTDEDISIIAPVLGDVDYFTAKFKDDNGEIRVSKIELESFVNAAYRNADENARADFATAYAKASQYLSSLPVDNEENCALAKKTMCEVAECIKPYLDTAKTFYESADKLIADCIPDVDYSDKQEIADAIVALENKAATAKQEMNPTEEDEEAIKKLLETSAVKIIEQAKKKLTDALEQAKKDAQALLLQEKSSRLSKE